MTGHRFPFRHLEWLQFPWLDPDVEITTWYQAGYMASPWWQSSFPMTTITAQILQLWRSSLNRSVSLVQIKEALGENLFPVFSRLKETTHIPNWRDNSHPWFLPTSSRAATAGQVFLASRLWFWLLCLPLPYLRTFDYILGTWLVLDNISNFRFFVFGFVFKADEQA